MMAEPLLILALALLVLAIVCRLARRPTPSDLAASERQCREMFERNEAVMLLVDPRDGAIVDANAAACAFYGYARDTLARMTIEDVSGRPRETLVRAREELREHQSLTTETRHRLASGDWRDLEVHATLLHLAARDLIFLILHDVTARKRMEATLRDSETRYRLLAEHVTDVIWIVDMAMRPTFISPSIQRLLGYTVAEALALPMAAIYTPDSLRTVQATLAAELDKEARGLRRRDDSRILDLELVRKDGTIVPAEINFSAVYDDRGKPAAILAVARDRTERHRVEQDLARERTLLRTIIDHLPVRLYVKDAQHRFLLGNRALFERLGVPDENALKGKTDLDFFPRALAAGFHADEDTVFDTGRPLLDKEERTADSQGRDQVSLTTKVPLHDSRTQAVVGIVGIGLDITARKHAEEALRESEQRFRLFLRHCPAAVFVKDADARFLLASHHFETILHRPLAEIVGRTGEDLVPPEMARLWREQEFGVLHTGKPIQIADTLEGRHYATWKFAIPREGKPPLLGGFALDVTDQKSTQEQLIQAQKMESVGRLAGGIAHDFNNLLQTILGFSELLLAGLAERDERRDDVAEIQRAARRAATLTSQLLAFSRKQMIRAEPLDLNALVRDAGKMLLRLIGEDIHMQQALAPDLWRVKADAGQIQQVLMNLIVNARDAMPRGGRITITSGNVVLQEQDVRAFPESQSGRYVCLGVSDTGTGMSPEVRAHLFEPFFTTKGAGQGTGMGLAMVYGLIKQHGGWINVYSEIDQGSTFKIYLPALADTAAAADPDGHPLDRPTAGAGAPDAGKGERILLVEDDAGVRALGILVLQTRGYTVFSAVDARSALVLFDREDGRFDLLFSDVVLTDMNGIELAELLLARKPDLRILMTSGYTDDRSRWPVIGDRGWTFLQKPFASRDLLRAVRALLDKPATAPARAAGQPP